MSSSTGSATLEDLFTEVLGDLFEDLGGLRIEYRPEAERLFGIEDYQTSVTENPCGECPCGGGCESEPTYIAYEPSPAPSLAEVVTTRLRDIVEHGDDENALDAIDILRDQGLV